MRKGEESTVRSFSLTFGPDFIRGKSGEEEPISDQRGVFRAVHWKAAEEPVEALPVEVLSDDLVLRVQPLLQGSEMAGYGIAVSSRRLTMPARALSLVLRVSLHSVLSIFLQGYSWKLVGLEDALRS